MKTALIFNEKILLNGVAGVFALISVANIFLTYFKYGTSESADAWMLSVSVVQVLALVSQGAVEQFSVFYAALEKKCTKISNLYLKATVLWAIASGALLYFSSVLSFTWIIGIFSPGYGREVHDLVYKISIPLAFGIATAPVCFVLKQHLMFSKKNKLSIIVANIYNESIFCSLLIVSFANNKLDIIDASYLVCGFVFVLTLIFCALQFNNLLNTRVKYEDFRNLWPMVKSSFYLRLTHSLHNFLSVIIINSSLSYCGTGVLAAFQYAKRLAEGLIAVSISPHANVYQIEAIKCLEHKRLGIKNTAIAHCKIVGFVSIILILLCGITYEAGNYFAPEYLSKIYFIFPVFVFILIWQIVVAFEFLPVAFIVAMNMSRTIFIVNALFIVNLYLYTESFGVEITGVALSIGLVIFQMISLFLYSTVFIKFIFKK